MTTQNEPQLTKKNWQETHCDPTCTNLDCWKETRSGSCGKCGEWEQKHSEPSTNKPQLSAEMDKRVDEELAWIGNISSNLTSEYGGDGETSANEDMQRVKHFLATALEEQKADYRVRVLSEIYVMVEDNHIEETAINAGIWDDSMSGYNEAIEDILQQLREKIQEMQDSTPPATAEKK